MEWTGEIVLLRFDLTYSCAVVSRASTLSWVSTHDCTEFQGVNIAASIQMYGSYISGKRPRRWKLRVMFKRPWALNWDTTVTYFS